MLGIIKALIQPDWRDRLLYLHNGERSKYRVGVLTLSTPLNQMAQGHSDIMAKTQKLSHDKAGDGTFAQRLLKFKIFYTNAAENIAQTYNDDINLVFKLWMSSTPHKYNILQYALTEVGFGLSIGKNKQSYWTSVFRLKDGFGSDIRVSGAIIRNPELL
jgi:uncharacterized protein YkwD